MHKLRCYYDSVLLQALPLAWWMATVSRSHKLCVLLLTAHRKAITWSLGVFMQEPASLQPLHVLQCHSKNDSEEDFSTQLWACAFEPSHDKSSEYL